MAADPEEAELVAAWRAAVARPDVVGELEALHAAVAEAVARERPICLASGQCCHFERHGHRLYVTGLEAVWCVTNLARRDGPEGERLLLPPHGRPAPPNLGIDQEEVQRLPGQLRRPG